MLLLIVPLKSYFRTLHQPVPLHWCDSVVVWGLLGACEVYRAGVAAASEPPQSHRGPSNVAG